MLQIPNAPALAALPCVSQQPPMASWIVPWDELTEDEKVGSDLHVILHDILNLSQSPYLKQVAWRIPGTAEPGGLPSMGLHRVRHD